MDTTALTQSFDAYINSLILQCLDNPRFSLLSPEEKQQVTEALKDHFYNAIMETIINNLNEEQVMQIKDLHPGDPQLDDKIEEFASGIPQLSEQLEQRLMNDAMYIKQTGELPAEAEETPAPAQTEPL